MLKKIIFLSTLIVLLAACMPAQQTVDVDAQVNTAVAGTMQSQAQIDLAVEQTVAAKDASLPLATPEEEDIALQVTNTTEPTPTLIIPTFTAIPPTKVPVKYGCTAYTQYPSSSAAIKPNEKFDIKWVIKNSGTSPWHNAVDIKFNNGTNFADVSRAEIKTMLQPGQSYDVVVDATAPGKKGTYSMVWMVTGPMCYAYTTITVK